MDNNLLRLKFKQRLNKLSSNDFTNIECWQEAELINKAQLQVVRRNLHGGNVYKEGDEQSVFRIDDLNLLLKEEDLSGSNQGLFFETVALPDNYMKFKRVGVRAINPDCDNPRRITVTLVEEANIDELLADHLLKPSFKWAETFCTIIGNKIRVYTNQEFSIKDCKLTFYRYPKPVVFEGCRDVNDQIGSDQPLEFREGLAELIVDEAVKIAAADMSDYNNYSRSSQNVETNN